MYFQFESIEETTSSNLIGSPDNSVASPPGPTASVKSTTSNASQHTRFVFYSFILQDYYFMSKIFFVIRMLSLFEKSKFGITFIRSIHQQFKYSYQKRELNLSSHFFIIMIDLLEIEGYYRLVITSVKINIYNYLGKCHW